MFDLLAQLNEAQYEAVTHGEGPLLVLAGAGSGKTRVITFRIAWLISQGLFHPQEILAVTFTNKAAGEMRERVHQLLPPPTGLPTVGTFHATAAKILRSEGYAIGIESNFTIYDAQDMLAAVKEVYKADGIDENRLSTKDALRLIQSAKTRLLDAAGYMAEAQRDNEELAARVYASYERKLKEYNALDFGDLILRLVHLLEQSPEVLERIRNRFRYLLIDEYQDTNHAQYRLTQLLVGGSGNICAVGDDDQSIYRFRGANLENILQFEKHFPNTRVITLGQNYRSTRTIVEAASAVAKNNVGRKPKTLFTNNPQGDRVILHGASDDYDEAGYLVRKIKELVFMHGAKWGESAVFYRTNSQSRVLEEVFTREGIPFVIIGGVGFYQRAEIKDLMAYLKALSDPRDSLNLKRIINVPKRGIGDTSVEHLEHFAETQGLSLFEACRRARECEDLSKGAAAKVLDFIRMMEGLAERVATASPSALLTELLALTGYYDHLRHEHKFGADERIANVGELLNAIAAFEERAGEDATLNQFLESATLSTSEDLVEAGADTVNLMTLHSAKGLEFPHVFLTGLEEGLLPHFQSMAKLEETEEERRLLYVGMTRARKNLTLTYAASRRVQGTPRYQTRSRFLTEIPVQFLEETGLRARRSAPEATPAWRQTFRPLPQANASAPSLAAPSKIKLENSTMLRRGDQVRHNTFGTGSVLRDQELDRVTVFFPNAGTKTILTAYVTKL